MSDSFLLRESTDSMGGSPNGSDDDLVHVHYGEIRSSRSAPDLHQQIKALEGRERQVTILRFLIKNNDLKNGEFMAVTGSSVELGEWDISKCIHLKKRARPTTNVALPEAGGGSKGREEEDREAIIHFAEIEVTTGEPFEYKYIVLRKWEVVQWETIVGNRFLNPGSFNVARAKPSRQSSTMEKSFSSNAVNGSVFGNSRRHIARTLEEANPWWEVDLMTSDRIDSIVVWQRNNFRDSRHGGAAPFWLYLHNDSSLPSNASIEEVRAKAVFSYCFRENQRRNVCEFPGGITGRYVRVQSEGTKNLELAEVQVFAVATPEFLKNQPRTFARETSIYQLVPKPKALNLVGGLGFLESGEEIEEQSQGDEEEVQLHIVNDGWFGEDIINLEQEDEALQVNTGDKGTELNVKLEEQQAKRKKKKCIDEEWLNPQFGPELHLSFGTRVDFSPVVVFPTSESAPTGSISGYKLRAFSGGVAFEKGSVDPPPIRSRCVMWVPGTETEKTPGKLVRSDILRNTQSLQVFVVGLSELSNEPDAAIRVEVSEVTASNKENFLGYSFITLSTFNNTRGVFNTPILKLDGISSFPRVIGEIYGGFLVVKPFVHVNNNLSEVWRTYWIKRPSLDVGHRGVGRSFKSAPGFRKAAIRENTTLSFITAGRYSADFVEFDVQLSKDKVPVIYHDFELVVGVSEISGETHDDLLVPIHSMTLAQLQNVRQWPALAQKEVRLKKLIKKHWDRILRLSSAVASPERNPFIKKAPKLASLLDQLPTLVDLLRYVPKHVGFDVEIKYPVSDKVRALCDLPEFEMNSFIDAILNCIFEYAGSRRIVFSCFHPDICVLLRAKQAKYPVLFLTEGGMGTDYSDQRCLSVVGAMLFSKAEYLQGVCSNSAPFLADTSLIAAVKSQGLLLFTWGDGNTDPKNVEVQRKFGVDGVISDNIGDITRAAGKRKSFFDD